MHPAGPPGQVPRGLPQIGQVVGGKYEIVRLLGEGGMAYVFEASHKRLDQRVALKVLAPEFARDAELVARFEREARAVAKLKTRHVTRVMDVEETPEGVPYIVMEFLEGRDLDAELEERQRLPLEEAVDIVLQACAGMIEAHGIGIVHRDLKPANLFLAKEGEGKDRIVKVLDFGISKIVGEATRLTQAGAVMGTVLYMSPEQVRAQPTVDTRADIWALGVILYELVAGRAPWEGSSQQIAGSIVSKNPPDIRKFVEVPETIANVLSTMLQREPDRRFATVQDVLAALAPFAPPGSIGASVAEQLAPKSRAKPAVKNLQLHTIPMGSRPSALEVAMQNVTRAAGPSPGTPTAVARPAPEPPRPTSGRLLLVIAIALGVIGAAGVALIVMTKMRKPPVTVAVDAATVPIAVSSPPALPPHPPPTPAAPPSVIAEEVTPPPPSTGTAGRPTPHGRKDGGGATKPAPSGSNAPAFL